MPLRFLVTSPRVAPGLMTWAAWQALSAADRVLASDPDLPSARAVLATGRGVDVLPDPEAADLLAAATAEDVAWLASDAESQTLVRDLAEQVVLAGEAGGPPPEVEVLHASYDVPGARLLDLVAVMDRLRTGCPWDREQTHRTLARYLLEETYETLEAIDSGDHTHLREELGDLLLQVVFHARIAEEDGEAGFTVDDVAGGIVDKLVHRHPHVFAGVEVADAAEVETNWEALKSAEKGRGSVLEGIPAALPALALADKVLGRATRVGVDVAAIVAAPDGPPPGETLGDRLLALVAEAREAGLDAEQQLRDAVRRLTGAVRDAESP